MPNDTLIYTCCPSISRVDFVFLAHVFQTEILKGTNIRTVCHMVVELM